MRKLALAAALLAGLGGRGGPAGGSEIFRDASAEAGLSFEHHNGASGELYLAEIMGPGGALFDYDGDGDLDLYLLQGEALGPAARDAEAAAGGEERPTGELLRNDLLAAGLRLVPVSRAAGLPSGGYPMGVAVGDIDNDGFPDLYLAALGDNRLLRNRGDGSFAEVTAPSGTGERRWSAGAAFLDFDRDGHLDLYVVNYVDFVPARNKLCPDPTGARDYCGPSAFSPLPDRLFRGRGDGTFADVSAAAGIQAAPSAGLGVASGDFDGNGWPDLYVANDGMANHLFLNQGDGSFRDEALLAGCAVNSLGAREASMGIAAGDADGDGHEDLFLTHLHGETNTLYLADGRGLFRDATEAASLGTPSWTSTGFGTAFLDLENDGDLDLFAGNGHVTLFAGRGRGLAQGDQLFRNRGGGSFEDVPAAEAGAPFRERRVTRGAARGDVDNDGDADLLLLHNGGPARLLRNEAGSAGPWLGVRVLGPGGRDAYGAAVEVLRPGRPPLLRRIRSDGSYASASDPRALFGLGGLAAGEECRLESLTVLVVFPDGRRRVIRGLPAGHYLTLR